MTDFNWTAKGTDGASFPADHPLSNAGDRLIPIANETFRRMVLAVESDDIETAQSSWEAMCDQVGNDVNPYGLFVTVALIFNATVIRILCDDPDPFSQPHTTVAITALGWDVGTSTIVDTPLEGFAATAIAAAANWQWDDLNTMMLDRLRMADNENDFLHDLASCLMSLFIGVGGIEHAGWKT